MGASSAPDVGSEGCPSVFGSVTDLLHNRRWEPQALRVERGSLDDVFRQITTAH